MRIAYISDLHLDFYIQMKAAWKRKTTAFLRFILPETNADVLINAGDLSHYNAQSVLALQFFSEHYDQIFFVLGNHDYYLISKKQRSNYKNNSLQRNSISNKL